MAAGSSPGTGSTVAGSSSGSGSDYGSGTETGTGSPRRIRIGLERFRAEAAREAAETDGFGGPHVAAGRRCFYPSTHCVSLIVKLIA